MHDGSYGTAPAHSGGGLCVIIRDGSAGAAELVSFPDGTTGAAAALMLPEECRRPALVMICAMQTMILAAQGRRSYSVQEWQRLHYDTAMEFFGSMEHLMYYKQEHDTKKDTTKFTPMER